MNEIEFRNYIEYIGFIYIGFRVYKYKEFKIELYFNIQQYDFYNGSGWIYGIPYTDLTPELKRLIRSYKLKRILE